MKRYTPYIFPLVVLGIIFLLVFRWYNLRTERMEYSLLGEGVEIENLSQEELARSIQGAGDYESVELESDNPDNSGVIRYEVVEDKVRFSVMANLPEAETEYRVWLKETDGTAMREVFSLTAAKGGYIGSAALPSELLPFQVIVTQETQAEMAAENVILQGTIEASGEPVEDADTMEMEVEVLEGELN